MVVRLNMAKIRNIDFAGNNDMTQNLESPYVLAGKCYVRNPSGLCVLAALQRADWWLLVLGVAAGALRCFGGSVDLFLVV